MKPPSPTLAPRAAIYTRISSDPALLRNGVDRQEEDCRALAQRLGYEVEELFEDNDVSASNKSRKPRPRYDDMMAGARAGRFDVILAYSNSRLTRRVREYLDLIELHEKYGVRIRTAVSGDYDLSTADGRGAALTVAVWDAAEAERTAERTKRAKQQMVAEGRYRGGKRPFGFEKDGETIRPAEAVIIREMTTAVLEGRSVRGLAMELNKRGVKTSMGAEWTQMSLRDVLLRPRNAGLISSGHLSHGNLKIHGRAVWDAIVPEETWRSVYKVLTDTSRRTNTGKTAVHWRGSGIFRCGRPLQQPVLDEAGQPTHDEDGKPIMEDVADANGETVRCGAPMRVSVTGGTESRPNVKRRYYYRCGAESHLMIDLAHTDDFVLRYVAQRIRMPEVVAQLQPSAVDLAPFREEQALLTTRLESFELDYALGHINGTVLAKSSAVVTAELVKVQKKLADAVQHSTSSPILNAPDPGAAFLGAPVDVQRAVIASVARVQILPAAKMGVAWTSDRVRIDPM